MAIARTNGTVTLLDELHDRYVHDRRTGRLSHELAALLPADANVLDVGCGDGLLSAKLMQLRPDVTVSGVDVLLRADRRIPTLLFAGADLPFTDSSFDVVLLVDVLHHADSPLRLLAEAARVASVSILLKDHLLEGPLASTMLRFMDRVGNAHHGVSLPYNYWPRSVWLAAFRRLGLSVSAWNERLRIYPMPASLLFDRSLHFIARLER